MARDGTVESERWSAC